MKRLAIALYCCSVMASPVKLECDETKCTVDRAMLESMIRDRDSNLEALHILRDELYRIRDGCQMVNS